MMFKRVFIPVLALALCSLLGGGHGAALANPPVPMTWDLGNPAVFQGLPDATVLRDGPVLRSPTANFLVLDGPANDGLGGGGGGEVGRITNLILTFKPTNLASPVRIALYDPDSVGLWDQFADGDLVEFPPQVLYKLYALPKGMDGLVDETARDALLASLSDFDVSNDPTPIFSRDALTHYNAGSDDTWCEYYDEQAMNVPAAAQHAFGEIRLLLHIHMVPNPASDTGGGAAFLGKERVGHKVAFNGTYLFPAGAVVGFGGGAIDERATPRPNANNFLDHSSRDLGTTEVPGDVNVETRFYDGTFNFHIHSTQACEQDVEFFDGDADWNPTPEGASFDPNPTGIPPENVENYVLPADPSQIHNIAPFLVGQPISWGVFPLPAGFAGHIGAVAPWDDADPMTLPNTAPAGFTSFNRVGSQPSTNPAHPSITADQQDDLPGSVDAFQQNVLDQATLHANPGLWCLRWSGVDKANFVWMRFNPSVGTTPRKPMLTGQVFCDENGNGVLDAGELPPPAGTVTTVSVQKVDCGSGAADGAPFDVAVDAMGLWGPVVVVPGCYDVDLPASVPFTSTVTLPRRVMIDEFDCMGNVEIPLNCNPGEICGSVYCEDTGNCLYGAGDNPLPVPARVTVTLTEIDVAGNPVPGVPVRMVEVVAPETDYCFRDLPLGRYRVTYMILPGDPVFPLSPDCEPIKTSELTLEFPKVEDCDFGFDCKKCKASGKVWCEAVGRDCDGIYTLNVDTPIPGLTVTLLSLPGRTLVATTTTDANGDYMFTELDRGDYAIVIPPGQPQVQDKNGPNPMERTFTCGTGLDVHDHQDFWYNQSVIQGTVFCDLDGDLLPGGPMDMPTQGIVVTLTGAGIAPATSTTDANGHYEFAGLRAGTYTVSVLPESQFTSRNPALQPPAISTQIVVLMSCDEATVNFIPSCLARIVGTVWKDPLGDCDGVLGPNDDLLAGIEIRLTGPTQMDVRTTTTNATGDYAFEDLVVGSYSVEVIDPVVNPDNCTFMVSVAPPAAGTPARVVPVVLGAPFTERRVDFGYCVQQVCGTVFERPICLKLDTPFDPNQDIPVADVWVEIVGVAGDALGYTNEVQTAADGTYCFSYIPTGNYEIIVSGRPANADPLKELVVDGAVIRTPAVQVGDVIGMQDFPYCRECPQELCVLVYKESCPPPPPVEPCGPCKGRVTTLTLRYDGAVAGLVSVEAKKGGTVFAEVVQPGEEFTFSGNDGDGTFGTEITVTGPGGTVAIHTSCSKPIGPGLVFGDYTVISGESLEGGPLCRGGDAGKSGKSKKSKKSSTDPVVLPPLPVPECNCDGVFDAGTDQPVANVRVRVEQLTGEGAGRVFFLTTDASGRACEDELMPRGSTWRVSVVDGQAVLAGYELSPGIQAEQDAVFGEECEEEVELRFGYCEKCPRLGCCEGDLHEAVLTATFAGGDAGGPIEVGARLYTDCAGNGLIDAVDLQYAGPFPGAASGLDDVVHVEDVSIQGGLVSVRVRVTAAAPAFPAGHFGSQAHRLVVSYNGQATALCEPFRAETLRIPGTDCEIPCGPCKGKVTRLTLRYDGAVAGLVTVESKKGGTVFAEVVLPGQAFSFSGTEDGGTLGTEINVSGPGGTVAIHTSCSKPIGPGLVFGDFTVVSGESLEGGALCTGGDAGKSGKSKKSAGPAPVVVPVAPLGLSNDAFEVLDVWCFADYCRCNPGLCQPPEPCGPCKGRVTTLTLRYDGAVAGLVTVESKKGGAVFAEVVQPGGSFTFSGNDKDGTLGTEITVTGPDGTVAIHTSCSKPIGAGLRFGAYTVLAGASLEGGAFCDPVVCADCPPPPCDCPPPPTDCGPCKGRVTTLTLRYDGAAAGLVTVEAKKGGTVFAEVVQPGASFSFSGTGDGGTLGTEITVTGPQGAVAIHTSCSKPIGPGLVFGAYTVISGESLEGGPLCAGGDAGKAGKSKKKSKK